MTQQPTTLGNAWNVIDCGDSLKFISDIWDGRIFGFEERDEVTLAQTGTVAVGCVGFGGGIVGAERVLGETFPFHLCDEKIAPTQQAIQAAEAGATFMLDLFDERRLALPLAVSTTVAQSSILEQEALPGSALRKRLQERVAAAVKGLERWEKTLYIDRIHLNLLEGEAEITQRAADMHYAAVARSLVEELGATTGQPSLPHILVCQDAGLTDDGRSEVILAEGRLDLEHPSLNFVVVTPLYWCGFERGSMSMISADDAMEVSKLESLAIAEIHAGRRWFCPCLDEAVLREDVIAARFLAMGDLELLDPVNHGFELDGVTNEIFIEDVSVEGRTALIKLSGIPEGELRLRYAFGRTKSHKANMSANFGSVCEKWRVPGVKREWLRRWALSAQVPVVRAI